MGSPPRVRGEVSFSAPSPGAFGITPACAGRSLRLLSRSGAGGDHPRVCGEKRIRRSRHPAQVGSPPRVRGEAVVARPKPRPAGITPACAGRRALQSLESQVIRDHPRVCGEKTDAAYSSSDFPGSPPRVRGEANIPLFSASMRGITPACAGRSQHEFQVWRQ